MIELVIIPIGLLAAAGMVLWLTSDAPHGHEDEDGFHEDDNKPNP